MVAPPCSQITQANLNYNVIAVTMPTQQFYLEYT